jgi:hypothetical protein
LCKIPSQNQPIWEGICPFPIKSIIKVKDILCAKFGVLILVQNQIGYNSETQNFIITSLLFLKMFGSTPANFMNKLEKNIQKESEALRVI